MSGTLRQRSQLLLTACGISNPQISPKSLTESQHQGKRRTYLNVLFAIVSCRNRMPDKRLIFKAFLLLECHKYAGISSQISNHSVRRFTELFVSAPANKDEVGSGEPGSNVHLMLAEEE